MKLLVPLVMLVLSSQGAPQDPDDYFGQAEADYDYYYNDDNMEDNPDTVKHERLIQEIDARGSNITIHDSSVDRIDARGGRLNLHSSDTIFINVDDTMPSPESLVATTDMPETEPPPVAEALESTTTPAPVEEELVTEVTDLEKAMIVEDGVDFESDFMDKLQGLHVGMEAVVSILKEIAGKVGCTNENVYSSDRGRRGSGHQQKHHNIWGQQPKSSVFSEHRVHVPIFDSNGHMTAMSRNERGTVSRLAASTDLAGVPPPIGQTWVSRVLNGKMERSSDCPPPFNLVRPNDCLFLSEANQVTWSSARQICNSLGADLVHPKLEGQGMDFVLGINEYTSAAPAETVWVGASDRQKEGVWTWVNGQTAPTDLPWEPGHPKSFNGREDCMAMEIGHPVGLQASNCMRKKPFICQKE